MSGEILLRAEDARSAADAVKNAAQDVLDQFNSLKARLAPLGDSSAAARPTSGTRSTPSGTPAPRT